MKKLKGFFKRWLKNSWGWLHEVLYEDLYEAQFDLAEYDHDKGLVGQLPHVWALTFLAWIFAYTLLYFLPWVGLSNVENIFPWSGIKWEGFRLEKSIWDEFSLGRPVWESLTWDGFRLGESFWEEFSLGRPTWDNFTWENINPGAPFDRLYFSIITITTLGYGDISPITWPAKIIVACESVTGLVTVGLFLNALSHQHGAEVQEKEKNRVIGQITGGRAFPVLEIQVSPDAGSLEYWYTVHGDNPLYDVKAQIHNHYGFEDKEMTELGVLLAGFKNKKRCLVNKKTEQIKFGVTFYARNGHFIQNAEFIKTEKGKWYKRIEIKAYWAEEGKPESSFNITDLGFWKASGNLLDEDWEQWK